MNVKFAKRMDFIKASEIRESLKLIANPNIISFAGGNPDPDTFPVEAIGSLTEKILKAAGGMALQYSPTEGFDPLRKKIAARVKTFGIESSYEDVLITSGSQQALSLTGDVFLDEGDTVVCENPTYFGALNAFKKYLPKIAGIETEEDGMNMTHLEEVLKNDNRVKFIYVIPDYQNPTGNSWSLGKREKLVRIAQEYSVPIVEDNPYYEVYFDEGQKKPSVKHFDENGTVIFLGSYSKTFCPGLRVGWAIADQAIIKKYIIMKQGADLQSNTLSQRQLDMFLEETDFDSHVNKTRSLYKERRDLMLSLIERDFPKECEYTKPHGGFFIWIKLPEQIDGDKLLLKAIEHNVAYISGSAFYPNEVKKNYIRLSYSTMKPDKIRIGMEKLSSVIKDMLNS